MTRVYCDAAGSQPILAEVVSSLRAIPFGAPGSLHAEGRAARHVLDAARDEAAAALGRPAAGLTFTSNGTEAVNLALLGAGRSLPPGLRIVAFAGSHASVLAACQRLSAEGRAVTVLPVDRSARGEPSAVPADAGLVTVDLANADLGTTADTAGFRQRSWEVGALLHVNCCLGLQFLAPPDADLISVSGHKIGAGQGGLLSSLVGVRLEPQLVGGPAERSLRAGREDVSAAVAIARALTVAAMTRERVSTHLAPLGRRLQEGLAAAGALLTGSDPRLPGFATGYVPGRRAEDALMALDLAGLAASAGAVCASGSVDPSPALLAAGYSLAEALGGFRLSLLPNATESEVDEALLILRQVLKGGVTDVRAG